MADGTCTSAGAAVRQLLGAPGEAGAVWGAGEPAVLRRASIAALMPTIGELLNTPLLRPPFVLLMSGGKPLDPRRYCREAGIITGSGAERTIDKDCIAAERKAGAGIKFNRIELWNTSLAELARELECATSKTAKIWGFVSPRGETMFPVHRDPAHVLAVQLDGTKEWRLDGPCPAGSWNSLGSVTGCDEPLVVTLEPGDALYLPYGYAHSAKSTGEYSYHVTFALEGITVGELRTRVVRALYDHLDRNDGTEVRPGNLGEIVADISKSVALLADGLAPAIGRCDAGELRPDHVSAVLAELMSGSGAGGQAPPA